MIPRAFRWRAWACLWAVAGAFAQGDGRIESDRYREGLHPQGYVNDWAGVFAPEQKDALERRLAEAKQASGAELAVVTLPSLQGGEINDFTHKLFQQWGIGEKGKDNGILLLMALEERRVRIEPGYGFEETLTDARCGRILDAAVIPKFKEGDYAGGLIAGADLLLEVMGGKPLPDAIAREPVPEGDLKDVGIWFAFLVIFVFVAFKWGGSGSGGGSGGGGGGGGSRSGGSSGGFSGGRSGGGGASRGW